MEHDIRENYAVVIPAGTRHNIVNTSNNGPMKLYTIYSPPEHRDGIIHPTREDAMTDNEHFDENTTE
jgi:mannose-6-phosphate isomerase-like protein (cupin superfamily)